MSKRVWIARDTESQADYEMYAKEPKKDSDGYFLGVCFDWFCKKEFEKITGYKLNPGEKRRVRIKIEEV